MAMNKNRKVNGRWKSRNKSLSNANNDDRNSNNDNNSDSNGNDKKEWRAASFSLSDDIIKWRRRKNRAPSVRVIRTEMEKFHHRWLGKCVMFSFRPETPSGWEKRRTSLSLPPFLPPSFPPSCFSHHSTCPEQLLYSPLPFFLSS